MPMYLLPFEQNLGLQIEYTQNKNKNTLTS